MFLRQRFTRFNSLFEMQLHVLVATADDASFNSLFEMLAERDLGDGMARSVFQFSI